MFTKTITWVPNGIFGGFLEWTALRVYFCTLIVHGVEGDGNTPPSSALVTVEYMCVVSQFFLRYYIHQNLPLDYSIIHNEM